jgi:hypothetical protein
VPDALITEGTKAVRLLAELEAWACTKSEHKVIAVHCDPSQLLLDGNTA